MRNLITDVAGAQGRPRRRRPPRLGRHRDRVRRAGGRRDRRARRRAGHARDRPARSGRDGRAHRRHRAVRRLGLRPRCRVRRAGLAARARPRLCRAHRAGADRAGGAILFDLLNGGDKNWGRFPPYRDLGYAAAAAAAADFALGTAGAGFGATTVNLKGGLGSASAVTRGRPYGRRARRGQCRRQRHDRRRPSSGRRRSKQDGEFGGLGFPAAMPPDALALRTKGRPARTPRSSSSRPTRR